MSLDWDITKIDHKITRDAEGKLSVKTESMIFATMSVGIGEITEASAQEFYVRLSLYERIFGTFIVEYADDRRVPVYLTPQDVRDHIGLRTNVFPKETDAAWRKRIFDAYKREASRQFDRTE